MSGENKKFNASFSEGKLKLSVDSNSDGDNVLDINVNMDEAIQEMLKRGEAIQGAKIAEIDFSLSNLVVRLDTDKDGEKLLEIKLNLAELLEEVGLKI